MKSSVEIRPISYEEMKAFYNGIRAREVSEIFGAFIDGECVGVSGVMRDPAYFGTLFEKEGRIIGFLDIKADLKGFGPRAVRAIRTYLRAQPHDIYVQCDAAAYLTAPRLLRLLGFSPTGNTETNMQTKQSIEVWKWQR